MENCTEIEQLKLVLSLGEKLQDNAFLAKLKAMKLHLNLEVDKSQSSSFLKFIDTLPEKDLANLPLQKVKRLYMDGCFDLMHSGHFNAIRQAKLLCETLVCGVISSEAIQQNKGPNIMTLEERVALAKSCKWVDEVVIQETYNPTIEFLDQNNCSHCAHGDDMIISEDGSDGYYEMKKTKRIKIVKRTEGISTTDLIGRLLMMSRDHHQTSPESKHLRKISNDCGIQSSQIDDHNILHENNDNDHHDHHEGKENHVYQFENQIQDVPNLKILNTTRRIKQFSTTREIQPNDVVIYVAGSFDIIHLGHIEFLQKAKEMGTFLIAGIHDDETISQYKGKHYPVLNLQERVLNLLANKYVDEVIIGAPWKITQNMIKNFNINYVIQGQNPYEINDPYEVAKEMGIHRQIEVSVHLDTEEFINRILNNRKQYLVAQEKKQKKQEKYYQTQNFDVAEL